MVVGLLGFVNKEPVISHVLVSLAHVLVMVDQSSAKDALVAFVRAVVGFEVLIRLIQD